jgi:hypothetical protein
MRKSQKNYLNMAIAVEIKDKSKNNNATNVRINE